MSDLPAVREDGKVSILATDPAAELGAARAAASALQQVLKPWETNLGGSKPHVQVEGWQTVAAMTGHAVLPDPPEIVHDITPNGDVYAWRCTARVVDRNGAVVGQGTAVCDPRENPRGWGKSNHSCQAMAETRASGRALRSRLAYIVGLAGYAAAPAEDVPGEETEAQIAEARKVTARERYKILASLASENEGSIPGFDPKTDGPALFDDSVFARFALAIGSASVTSAAVSFDDNDGVLGEAISMLEGVRSPTAAAAKELLETLMPGEMVEGEVEAEDDEARAARMAEKAEEDKNRAASSGADPFQEGDENG